MEPKVEEGFCVLGGRSYHTHLNYFYLIMATYTSLIRASLQEEICPSSPPVVVLLSSPFPEKIIVTPITTHTPPSLTLPTGAILSEPITDPKSPKITGSVLLAVADSREQVIEQLKRDIYFTSGVWDWDKVQIHPVSLPSLYCIYAMSWGRSTIRGQQWSRSEGRRRGGGEEIKEGEMGIFADS